MSMAHLHKGVVINNISVKHNALGVSQLLKVMVTPTTVVTQYLFYSKPTSLPELGAVS